MAQTPTPKNSSKQAREERRAERHNVQIAAELEDLIKKFNQEFPRRPRKPIVRKRRGSKHS